jgi:hypothetical protein
MNAPVGNLRKEARRSVHSCTASFRKHSSRSASSQSRPAFILLDARPTHQVPLTFVRVLLLWPTLHELVVLARKLVPCRGKLDIAGFILYVLLPRMLAPIRPRAIEVGESVFPRQSPRAEHAPALLFHVRIGCQRYHRVVSATRRFGHHEIGRSVILILRIHIRVIIPPRRPCISGTA